MQARRIRQRVAAPPVSGLRPGWDRRTWPAAPPGARCRTRFDSGTARNLQALWPHADRPALVVRAGGPLQLTGAAGGHRAVGRRAVGGAGRARLSGFRPRGGRLHHPPLGAAAHRKSPVLAGGAAVFSRAHHPRLGFSGRGWHSDDGAIATMSAAECHAFQPRIALLAFLSERGWKPVRDQCQRHYRPALLPPQRKVRGLLGGEPSVLILPYSHFYVAHPVAL
jgi:hypothetical protein